MKKIELAAALNTQCQIAEAEIENFFELLRPQQKASVNWRSCSNREDIIITLSFPFPKTAISNSDVNLLESFQKQFTSIQSQLLPMLFGRHITLLDYQLNNNFQATFHIKDAWSKISENLSVSVELCHLGELCGLSTDSSLRVEKELDQLISRLQPKLLFRLPSNRKIWNIIRLRETVYSFDYYMLENPEGLSEKDFVRLLVSMPGMANRRDLGLAYWAKEFQRFFKQNDNVLEYSVSSVFKIRSNYFLEARYLVS